jgi:signal-transduction protein with cAMP-binding, CBS, and nucleotidyltransferase domain
MVRAGFRHLVVVEGQEVTGLLSMRDIVRVWADASTPASTQATTATHA